MLRRSLVLAVLAAALAAPSAAHADAFDDVFADYQADGRITACEHSQAALESAQDQVPSDIEQYAPDFPAALEQALESRARSGCPKDGRAAGTTAGVDAAGAAPGGAGPGAGAAAGGAPAATPAGGVPAPPGTAKPAPAAADGAIVNAAAQAEERGSDSAPAPLVVLAVLGGLLALVLLLWGLLRFFAWEPRWLAGSRHAVAEAGWRTSGAWEDFTDWLRRGRTA
jgi:cobalamin biosynthesis Mg chelatase CobN